MSVTSKRRIGLTPLEIFAEAYVSQLKSGAARRAKRKFLTKAYTLLGIYLERPCCTDSEFTASFGTPGEDALVSLVRTEIERAQSNRRANKKSFERVYKLLLDAIGPNPCCP